MPQQTLALDDITLDAELQPRADIDRDLLDDYAAALAEGATFPPVVVFELENELLLADGYHRWHTHKALELPSIEADVRPGTRIDALRWALSANAAHGKRRAPGDYRRGYHLAVANGLVEAADPDAVMTMLRCSLRWAQELTQDARAAVQRQRDTEDAAKAAAGKSTRQIAAETKGARSHMAVQRALERQRSTAVTEAHSAQSLRDKGPTDAERQEAQQEANEASTEHDRERHEKLERARRVLTPTAQQWDAVYRALRDINQLPATDELLGAIDYDLVEALLPELTRARAWINRLADGYPKDGERRDAA